MKSAEEKALEICKKLKISTWKNGIEFRMIAGALMDHESDTRHACAEAIAKLEIGYTDAAHAACINAKVE